MSNISSDVKGWIFVLFATVALVLYFSLRKPERFEPAFRFVLTGDGVLLSDDVLRVDLKWGPMQQTPYRVNILSPPILSSMSGKEAAAGGVSSFQLTRSQAPATPLIKVTVVAVDDKDNAIAVERVSIPNPFVDVAFPIPVFDFALPIVQCAAPNAVIVPDAI
jgi:hypothetical protein